MSRPIRSWDDLPDVRHTYQYCADLAAILCPEVLDHEPLSYPDLEQTIEIEPARPVQWNRRRRAREATRGLERFPARRK